MVHGDFSTGSVFYTSGKVAKVFDFGVREVFREVAGPNRSVYASPAVVQGNPAEKIDDVYSLAVVCYELLSGRHPYDELPADQAFDKKLTAEPLSSLSDSGWDTLNRGLALTRGDRVSSVKELAMGLAQHN